MSRIARIASSSTSPEPGTLAQPSTFAFLPFLPVYAVEDAEKEFGKDVETRLHGRNLDGLGRQHSVGENKCAPPFTEAEFEIRYGTGVDTCAELIDLGLSRGLVEKSGNHLSFAGTTLGNGREKSRDALAQSTELQSTLRQAIAASGPVRPGRREAAA